jgi:hypothetical protein
MNWMPGVVPLPLMGQQEFGTNVRLLYSPVKVVPPHVGGPLVVVLSVNIWTTAETLFSKLYSR